MFCLLSLFPFRSRGFFCFVFLVNVFFAHLFVNSLQILASLSSWSPLSLWLSSCFFIKLYVFTWVRCHHKQVSLSKVHICRFICICLILSSWSSSFSLSLSSLPDVNSKLFVNLNLFVLCLSVFGVVLLDVISCRVNFQRDVERMDWNSDIFWSRTEHLNS